MDKSGDGELLSEVAKYLYGDWWLPELASQLSIRPPKRPRQGVAPNLVREWASGKTRPPLWVMQAMAQFVIEGVEGDDERSSKLKDYLSKINAAVIKADAEGWVDQDVLSVIIFEPEKALQNEMIASQSKEGIAIGTGVTATWEVPFAKAFGIPEAIDITLALARDMSVGIIAHSIVEWLLVTFKGRSEKITINRKESTFDRGELTKIVEETITYERK